MFYLAVLRRLLLTVDVDSTVFITIIVWVRLRNKADGIGWVTLRWHLGKNGS